MVIDSIRIERRTAREIGTDQSPDGELPAPLDDC